MAHPPNAGVKEMKDFLLTYNRIVEKCFKNCAANFNTSDVTTKEGTCLDRCMTKFLLMNQRIVSSFVEIQSIKQQRMFAEMQEKGGDQTQGTGQSADVGNVTSLQGSPTPTG